MTNIKVTKFISFSLLFFCIIANSQEIQIDSLTFNSIQFKNSSNLITFDLGQIKQSNEVKEFKLNITNISDSYIVIENFATGDDLVGERPSEPILPGRSISIKFRFLVNHLSNRTQTITLRYKDSKQEKLLISVVKYEVIENSLSDSQIFGKVTDENGQLLPQVNILIDKAYRRTETDFDGKYSIIANQNDTLVFSSVGMKAQKIRSDKKEINVTLQEIEPYKEIVRRPVSHQKPMKAITVVTKKDIENANNPKYDFSENAKNNVFVIFVSELISYEFNKEDLEFQQKYNIKYSIIENRQIDYLTKYNKMTFNHLKKQYKKVWQTEIRKDAVGLNNYF